MAIEADRLRAIREKVAAGQRLSFDDGLALEACDDLFALGSMANLGPRAVQRQLRLLQRQHAHQPDERLRLHVRLLRLPGRPGLGNSAYVMDRDQILERAGQAHDRGATELHIVGGLHHKLPFEYYVDVVRWIKEAYPEIHIKAYTAVEIEFFAKIARQPIREVLQTADRRRPGQPARRRGRDLPPRGPRADLRGEGVDRDLARRPPDGPPARPALERHDALRPHRQGRSTGSTTWSGSASFRTRPAASRRSSRWPSTPTTRGWTRSPSRRA